MMRASAHSKDRPEADPTGCPPPAQGDRTAAAEIADLAGTTAFAARLAAALAGPAGATGVLCLWGTLGAGKTAFVRALVAAAAGAPVEVPSPTFTLVQVYDLPGGPLWHFDLYRLADAAEVHELGWDEALAGGLVAVEWPDRLGHLLPHRRLDLVLAAIPAARGIAEPETDEGTPRRLALIGRGDWACAVVDRLVASVR